MLHSIFVFQNLFAGPGRFRRFASRRWVGGGVYGLHLLCPPAAPPCPATFARPVALLPFTPPLRPATLARPRRPSPFTPPHCLSTLSWRRRSSLSRRRAAPPPSRGRGAPPLWCRRACVDPPLSRRGAAPAPSLPPRPSPFEPPRHPYAPALHGAPHFTFLLALVSAQLSDGKPSLE